MLTSADVGLQAQLTGKVFMFDKPQTDTIEIMVPHGSKTSIMV